MFMKIRTGISKLTLTLAVGAAAALALSACGSSGAKASVSPGAQPSATTAAPGTTSAGSTAVVEVAMTTKFGNVLVDDNGMTLYTLKNNGKPVPCTGACAAVWPPLVLPSGATTATGASGVTGLGTLVKGGQTHVTENGAPLYRFSGDRAPGDTNGNGIMKFGGVWNVVMSSGSATPAAAPAPATPPAPTTPTTASSGGYGY